MLNSTKLTTLIVALVSTPACGAAPSNVGGTDASPQTAAKPMGDEVTSESTPISQRFKTLDEFLAHLERFQGPVDGPWYKEIRPGVYELQTGNLKLDGPEPQRTFTREELERKFGFRK